jgi:uncharacterized protein (DUF2336 family)
MPCACSPSLVGELESVLRSGSVDRRNEILRQVTDLFLNAADVCRDEHIELFDDVLGQLVDKVERFALIKLSLQLAPVENAPPKVVHRLANDDDIAISGPLIERSIVLKDDFLVRIAQTKSQAHLAAIACRSRISETVSDVVVERGHNEVTRKIVANDGARFSQKGFQTVAERAWKDEQLAVSLAARIDVPAEIVEELTKKATDIVKRRLLAAHPELKDRIEAALSSPEDGHQACAHTSKKAIFIQADETNLKRQLCERARRGEKTEAIALLARIAQVPVDSVKSIVRQGAEDGVLILCKAIGLGWSDAKAVLAATIGHNNADSDRRKAFEKYIAFTSDTAQRVMRFLKLRRTAKFKDLSKMM